MEIAGAVAVVTGGASGLGAATVRRFVDQGAKVVVIDINADKGEALAKEIGDDVVFVAGDVSSEDDVAGVVEKATAIGPLRIAMNCAGIGWAGRTINRDGSPHELGVFKKVLEVNLIGTFNVARLAASAMAATEPLEDNERGVIVNTASVAAFDGQIGQVAYSASKGGIVGMTLPIARDLAPAGIRMCTIAPGTFDTPLLGMLPEEGRQGLISNIPFPKRLGAASDYALLAEQIVRNSYLNGETIRLDGALRMPPK